MPTDTNIIPQRPTFDSVFANWNNLHLARFGTYVNTATAGAGNYERQVEDLKKQTAQEQAQWDATYGNTAAGKAISSNPPPTWQDSYNTWIKDYQKVFGTDQLNRPWSADADAVAQKQALDNDYLSSLAKYNEKNGTNIAPQAGVLGANAQPNSFYKEPEKNNDALGGLGNVLVDVDKFVNREIPGGWTLPAVIAAAVATGYVDPSLLASTTAAEGGATGAGGLTGGGAFVPAAGSGASFTIAPEAAYTVVGGAGGAAGVTATPGANAVLNSSTNIANLTPPGAGNFGSIVAPSANAVTNGAGLTGAIGAGTMVGDGTLGTTIGQTYMAAAPGQFAVDASGAAIPAGASGIAGTIPSSGISASDVLRNVNRAKSIANALTSGKTGQQAINPSALASLLTSPQEQFGGLYRMNEKPFLSTQQTASLSPDSYNVSGQNINSPIAPTNQLLANLLYPKA